MTLSVSRSVLSQLRLANQRLTGSTFRTPIEAMRWMTAIQGQDLPGALWSVGLRVPDARIADVRAALSAGAIVRSWPLRGTLHLTAAEDLGWIMGLSSARMITAAAGRHRQLDISLADVEKVRSVAFGMLDGGRRATRAELLQAFQAAGQPTSGQRGIHLLWLLSLTGTLVQGPPSGAQQLFVLTDEWIPHPRVLERTEALAELALRYFRSHGPATPADFAWWTKLTLTDARLGLQVVKEHLCEVTSGTSSYWLSRESADLLTAKDLAGTRSLLLLPGFDEYLLGYADRSVALHAAHANLIVPGGNGVFKPTMVSGGQVIGTWSKVAKTPKKAKATAVAERTDMAQATEPVDMATATVGLRPATTVGLQPATPAAVAGPATPAAVAGPATPAAVARPVGVEVQPFAVLTSAEQRGLNRAAANYVRFLQARA